MGLSGSLVSSIYLLGWALLHFLWQGTLMGLVYVAIRATLPRGEARYRWGMLVLGVMAICPFWTIWKSLEVGSSHTSATAFDFAVIETAGGRSWSWVEQLNAWVPWLVLLWSIGVLLLSLRVALQWRGLRQLAGNAEPLVGWNERVAVMAARFHLRQPVRVLCSNAIASPALLGGWLRPLILIPVAVVCDFPVRQIELILAHEMAHLRRWDPAANLFQVLLETLHFYHPVVRWISRDVRHEREICCDEMALSIGGGSRGEFVTMLADLGDLQERQSELLVAFAGGNLLDRVQHMVLTHPRPQGLRIRMPGRFLAAMACAILVALSLHAHWKQAQLRRHLNDSVAQVELLALTDTFPLTTLRPEWKFSAWAPVRDRWVIVHGKNVAPSERAIPAISHVTMVRDFIFSPRLNVDDFTTASATVAVHAAQVQQNPASMAPMPIYIQQPFYPRSALDRGLQGTVVMEFTLDDDGSVANPTVVQAVPAGLFDQSALEALRHWRYAVPKSGARALRYRQTFAFGGKTVESGPAQGGRDDVQVRAKAPCEMVTGSHICHMPGESTSSFGKPLH